jgi:hypothetical protein
MKDQWGRLVTRSDIDALIPDEALVFEPRSIYDKAICGTVFADGVCVAAYDRNVIHQALIEDGLTEEEASEWISYNTEGAYLGPHTPVVLPLHYDEDVESAEAAISIFARFVGNEIAEA